jgi:hypothetical protein
VSTSDDHTPSRLSSALADLKSRWAASDEAVAGDDDGPMSSPPPFAPAERRTESEFSADWSVDDDLPAPAPATAPEPPAGSPSVDAPPNPYTLPEIVPATADEPTAEPAPPSVPPPVAAPASDGVGNRSTSTGPARSYTDLVSAVPANAAGAPLRAPGRRPRVRRVTRVLRHIDPWSTFKVALLFSAVAYVVVLTAGVLLWRVADDTGTLDNVERWFTQFGWETFELKGGEIFQQAWIIGLFGVVALTGGLVLTATLFNLVSDIIGGVRVTVLEEEVVERTVSATKRYVVRRGPPASSSDQQWDVDAEGPTNDPAPPTADWSVDDDEPA